MHTLILVGGSFMAARCWDEVVSAARANHTHTRVVELRGLGDRAVTGNREVTLNDHIQDVVDALQTQQSTATLVAHSYAGVPALVAADRYLRAVRQRGDESHLHNAVLIGAMLPEPGASVFSTMPAAAVQYMRDLAHLDHAIPVMTDDQLDEWGDHGMTLQDRARFRNVTSPHPVGTYEQRCPDNLDALQSLPQIYVKLSGDRAPAPSGFAGQVVTFDSGHWPMITRPRALTSLLQHLATAPA